MKMKIPIQQQETCYCTYYAFSTWYDVWHDARYAIWSSSAWPSGYGSYEIHDNG
ncbi:hypothetical protein AVEN_235542-1 [Araneus ventricosus]|uniref:Uncharacterized protein n=1 Tax=Araneus ventricosus TaxID=182803 RepID=A0A4Y2NAF5_ARAVE|nr:hypothetical protein AVEN_235542-1 [Araneus ventricosus]